MLLAGALTLVAGVATAVAVPWAFTGG